jgi:hypothetical protein
LDCAQIAGMAAAAGFFEGVNMVYFGSFAGLLQ